MFLKCFSLNYQRKLIAIPLRSQTSFCNAASLHAKYCANRGAHRQISTANSTSSISCSVENGKAQRQLSRKTSPEDNMQEDLYEFVPKSLLLVCKLFKSFRKTKQLLWYLQVPKFPPKVTSLDNFTEKSGGHSLPHAHRNTKEECLPLCCALGFSAK